MTTAFVTGGSGFIGGRLIRALVERGDRVRALARSDRAAAAVAAAGAEAVRGDLDDVAAMTAGMAGCDVVFHAAANVAQAGPWADFVRGTIDGTRNALAAARAAGVAPAKFVHVSTEAVLVEGAPLVRADETVPRAARPAGPYPRSKGMAEELVVAAGGVIVRPRFVWGLGDTSLLVELSHAVRSGKFRWIGGGRHLTSTCHVANVVEGLLCAAERGRGGEIYFVTDGEPVEFRGFVTEMLATAGVEVGPKSVPLWAARTAAALTAWMREPPVSRTAIALIGVEVTVVDAKARRELGYVGRMSRAAGLAEMRSALVERA
nr:NAD-dependent epimerase/dehydratase family protein [Kofleriaceae bacterium]